MIFYNGIFHSNVSENDTFYGMEVKNKRITKIYHSEEEIKDLKDAVNLEGKHVYPCLIDGHTHMLLTVAVMAMGFNACEITPNGVEPHSISGVEKRVREYAASKKKSDVIAINNYILPAMDERRMPTKDELDDWGGGRAIVIYSIDGHSTSLSSAMLKKIGINPVGHSGVLQGEENERAQGRIIDVTSASIGIKTLAKGIGEFHNYCAEYGINIVGALEGNGDSKKDTSTNLIVHLARHFDVGVRLYLQYTDYERVKPFEKYMKHKRVGGCGDWEMDGAVGSHSAAFPVPFTDTKKTSECYYSQEFTDNKVREFNEKGYQVASHAIGQSAILRIIEAMNKSGAALMNRIEHCEFGQKEAEEELIKGRYAIMMQPGYAWIDKRYLHTYEQYLPEEYYKGIIRLKTLFESGVCMCGSSDSPVQDMDPYLQMLGMVEYYNEDESLTPYQAFTAYTKNAAKAIIEEDEYGTLEEGKIADFFTADEDFFKLEASKITAFRPVMTYYGGKAYKKKKGTVSELAGMLLKRPNKI